jgi:hypothetical protein
MSPTIAFPALAAYREDRYALNKERNDNVNDEKMNNRRKLK